MFADVRYRDFAIQYEITSAIDFGPFYSLFPLFQVALGVGKEDDTLLEGKVAGFQLPNWASRFPEAGEASFRRAAGQSGRCLGRESKLPISGNGGHAS